MGILTYMWYIEILESTGQCQLSLFQCTLELDSATRCNMLAESIERISPETDDKQQTVMFLAEQLRLLNAKPKGRRYSTDTLIRAFTWYHKSTACYLTIQRLFCLPSLRLLRDVASHLNTGGDNSSYKYLRNKVKYLKQHELLVTLQLDEIHIKPKMTYQNGKLIGILEITSQGKPTGYRLL